MIDVIVRMRDKVDGTSNASQGDLHVISVDNLRTISVYASSLKSSSGKPIFSREIHISMVTMAVGSHSDT